MKISVSYLKSIYNKEQTIKKIEQTSADYLHVDLMDGTFRGEKNFTIEEVVSLLKDRTIPLDIHLMVDDALLYLDELIKLKPYIITFHIESKNIKENIRKIKENNILVGIAINPETSVDKLKEYESDIDVVLVMSVNPGLGGQAFINSTVDKIKLLQNKSYKISVDGGINDNSLKLVKDYIDIAVSGSFICMNENYEEQINKLRNI